jgi:hypothetical protein
MKRSTICCLFVFAFSLMVFGQEEFQYASFIHAQNNLVEQEFSAVFNNFDQSKDTLFKAYDNQSFYWTNLNKVSTLHETRQKKAIVSAKVLFDFIPNQTIIKLSLNLSQNQLLIISATINNQKKLTVVDLITSEIVFQKNNIYDAVWINNVSVYYASAGTIACFHNTFKTTKSVKQFSTQVEHVKFTTTWQNEVIIQLDYFNKNEVWYVDNNGEIQPIKIVVPNDGVTYQINKSKTNWVCLIKSGSDFDQLLISPTLTKNAIDWKSVISTKDQVYIDNMLSTPEKTVITGYEKGNAFIKTYDASFAKTNNIKFDEQLYAIDFTEQPFLYKNKLIINGRNYNTPGFVYSLKSEAINEQLTSAFAEFNSKLFTANRSEINWGNHSAIITEVHRNRVKTSTNTIIIKPVSAPKEQLRAHFSPDELHLLALGYVFALVHIMPNKSLLNVYNNVSQPEYFPEVGLFNATQQLLKKYKHQKLVVLADGRYCNAVLNTIINHPTLFDGVVFNNPIFENTYANFSEQIESNLTKKEKHFLAGKKAIDPLGNIIYQDYPAMIFNLNSSLPSKSLVAIYNKLALENAGNNGLFCYTALAQNHLKHNLGLIINFIEQVHP